MSGRFNIIQDKKPVVDHWTTLEKGLYTLFQREFQDYKNWKAISNIKMYNPSAGPDIFNQKIGKVPEICEVYWKNEYVCDVLIYDTPQQALTKINDGMIELLTRMKGVNAL